MYEANKERLHLLLGRLVVAWRASEHPFNQPKVVPPQTYVPERIRKNARTFAFFLFILCLWMRGASASDTAAQGLVRLYDIDERLFDPHWVMHFDPVKLRDLLVYVGLGRDSEKNSEFWISNTRLLVKRWDGDPRSIFHDFDRYNEKEKWEVALSRIANQGKRGLRGGFAGFQKKMVAMLIYYLTATGLISHFDTPVPVDSHATRLVVIHKVFPLIPGVKYSGRRLEELLDAIRDATYEYVKVTGISSVELSNALWLFSRSMCSKSPAFQIRKIKDKDSNVIAIIPYEPKWTKAEERAYRRTCGRCVVHDTCELVMRSHYWYHAHKDPQGSLHIGEQLTPYQLTLLPPEVNNTLYE